jgi:DNA-binding CsgD family transcriptional regulator
MLPSPLPGWLRDRIAHVVASYKIGADLCEQRCLELAAKQQRRPDGHIGDEQGRLTDYRCDAKYCAGMATRLPQLLDDRLTAKERLEIVAELIALDNGTNQHSKEVPRDPRVFALWAWENPWKDTETLPPPVDGIAVVRTDERMQELGLTQREAEAWILVRGYQLEASQAAEIMGVSVNAVEFSVKQARRRMRASDEHERES